MKKLINKFLEIHGREDHPDITEEEHNKLIKDDFYYITEDLEGYYIKKNLSYKLSYSEKIIYKMIVNGAEN